MSKVEEIVSGQTINSAFKKIKDISRNDILLNKNKLRHLGENARERAEKLFTWDKVANNYLATIN